MAIPLKNQPNKKYWNVQQSTDDQGKPSGELYLYGTIYEEKWMDEDVTPHGLVQDINKLGVISELNVHIFSNGGDVFAGNAIYSILKQRKETVNVYIEGIAASIATVIAMAADNRYIDKNAMFMIHNPMLFLFGMFNTIDMGKMITDLNRVRDVTTTAYTEKTGMTADEINALLDANNGDGTWYNATQAIEAGFCDAITPDAKAPAEAVAMIRPNVYECRGHEIDISMYKRAPKLAATASRARNGGKKVMPKPKSKAILRGKYRAEIICTECPHCHGINELDTATKIVTPDPAEDATVAVPMDDVVEMKATYNYKAELWKITCTHCGGGYEYDSAPDGTLSTDDNAGYSPDDPIPQAVKKKGFMARVKSSLKPKAKAVKPAKMQTEEVPITCPECNIDFTLEIDPAIKESEVTCPGCGSTLDVDTSNIGENGGEAEPDDNGNDGVIVTNNAVQMERQRLMKLDGLAQSFPQFANAIDQFKKNGSSVSSVNNWIVKALAKNPDGQNAKTGYLNAARRDAEPLNRLGGASRRGNKETDIANNFNAIAARRGTYKNE